MNTNPYPAGRWSARAQDTAIKAQAPQSAIRSTETLASLRQAPLRELFWAADDSGLVAEARVRIDTVLANAIAAAALLPVRTSSLEPMAPEISVISIPESHDLEVA